MTIVSTGVDGLGDPAGPDEGLVDGPADAVGDGVVDGAAVSSGGPGSIDGGDVGGIVATAPRPPDVAHAALATMTPDNARIWRTDR
jgi:hypothetical protein